MIKEKITIGSIVVRLGKHIWQPSAKIGHIYKINVRDGNIFYYNNYNEILRRHCRLATNREIAFFRAGGKNINSILKIIDSFSII
jgi:hypothetical protein